MKYSEKIEKEEVAKLPILELREGHKITLVETSEALEHMLACISKARCIGIDTESRPAFKKGVYHGISLIQLSTDQEVFLVRTKRVDSIPSLLTIFENEQIKKIGLSLRDDLREIKRLFPFEPKGFIDLQNIAKDYGILELSLKKMVAIVLGRKLSKKQRLSNWENETLTPEQKNYAALDAWAPLLIYQTLEQNT